MDRQTLLESACCYLASSEDNRIAKEKALAEELVAVQIFDEPILAAAAADDPGFEALRSDEVIGAHAALPTDWLPGAKSVVSLFFPFTKTIRDGNKVDMSYPSKGWMHGRVEGQVFIDGFSAFLVELLRGNGFDAVAPSIHERFFSVGGSDTRGIGKLYTSNWSERHVGYVCGLGTFGLSKGIITEKGMAGRLTSVVTDLQLTPDGRAYQRFDENCVLCGKCIQNCLANAISFEHGKDHEACSKFVGRTLAENKPRYGCGKCQVGVPCEARNPKARVV